MSLAITDEHRSLAGVARSFLESHKSRTEARTLLDSAEESKPAFWAELSSLGWLGLHIPETYGGQGYGTAELAVVLEEMGRASAPGPFLSTVLAAGTIAGAADESLRQAVLPSLVNGVQVAAVGLGGSLSRGQDGTFSGDAGVVLSGSLADLLLLPVDADMILISLADPGVLVEPCDGLDSTRRLARVRCVRCVVPADRIIRDGRAVALRLARTMASAEAAGGAAACLDMTVEYAQQRVQFNRPIGSFQAVKHQCATLRTEIELAAAAAWDAARAQDEGNEPEADLAAAIAAAQALPCSVQAAQRSIQLHGGIAYTWQHDAHLYLRRAVTLSAVLGAAGCATQDALRLIRSGARRSFSIDLPDEAAEYRRQAHSFAEKLRAVPTSERRDVLASSSYLVPHWPKPWGRSASPLEQLVIEEELADIERPVLAVGDAGGWLPAVSAWVTLTLVQHGTAEQHDRWIEPSLRGATEWCQLFSEPGAGSDAAAISTRGEEVPGGWRVRGQKVWTSGAQHCDWGVATVRTDPSAGKHAGITMMAIDLKAPGVDIRPLREITGEAWFNEVFLDDVFVPDTDVIGEVGAGWAVARAVMGNERVSMGKGSGSGMPAPDLLPLLERYRPGDPVAERDVADLLIEGLAMGLINLRHLARTVAGDQMGAEANITKLLAAEHAQRVSELAIRLAGADAVAGQTPDVTRNYLFTRCLTIGGGTSEIMRNQIAERVLGLPREPSSSRRSTT
jgi:alkylation response protein AidB-like acyl-CoA dehydrogenase